MTAPNVNPAAEAARRAFLAAIDGVIARAPAEWQPGLLGLRAEVEAGTVLPADIVGNTLKALGESVLSGQFGPATYSDSDHA